MAEVRDKYKTGRGLMSLWTGLLTGPIVWLIQFQASYTLVPWACAYGHEIVFHLVTLVSLALVAFSTLVAWRAWRETGGQRSDSEGTVSGRSRFMAILGVLVGTMFFLVILAQGIASFVVSPCQK